LRTFHHRSFTAQALAAERRQTVSICLPARDEAATIGPILEALLPLRDQGVVDQVVVVDDSTDGTGAIARRLGAEVHVQSELVAELGPVRGKGDALWRSLAVLTGDLVCFLDADSRDLGPHFALGLVGPLLTDPSLQFVKAFYRRPWQRDGVEHEEGGGRVTELTARPLLRRFFPELADVRQPLAGEFAVRRELLMRLPFCCGYAVDVALLIDAWRQAGTAALAQVDLDTRQNRHRPLAELGPMADDVVAGIVSRVAADGRLSEPGAGAEVLERPTMARYAASARRSRFTVASA
jgi:glucosyl-3-phosphoglycerate synthase